MMINEDEMQGQLPEACMNEVLYKKVNGPNRGIIFKGKTKHII